MNISIDFSLFEKKTGIIFKDKELLIKAFTHSSFAGENPNFSVEGDSCKTCNNERLEFLGDSVLGLIISDYLFKKFPNFREGILTNHKTEVVRTKTLAEVAQKLEMDKFILFGKGQKHSFKNGIGLNQRNILADTFEAYVAAVYLDQGYFTARDFVLRILVSYIDNNMSKETLMDSKSLLALKTQKYLKMTPSYLELNRSNLKGNDTIKVGVFFGEVCIADGTGETKKDAEQYAARKALLTFDWPK